MAGKEPQATITSSFQDKVLSVMVLGESFIGGGLIFVLTDVSGRYYPQTKDAAKGIENYVAFYKNKVTIQD